MYEERAIILSPIQRLTEELRPLIESQNISDTKYRVAVATEHALVIEKSREPEGTKSHTVYTWDPTTMTYTEEVVIYIRTVNQELVTLRPTTIELDLEYIVRSWMKKGRH